MHTSPRAKCAKNVFQTGDGRPFGSLQLVANCSPLAGEVYKDTSCLFYIIVIYI